MLFQAFLIERAILETKQSVESSGSMWFGILLLIVLSLFCVAAASSSEAGAQPIPVPVWAALADIITALRLDQVFTAPRFLAGTALIILNLSSVPSGASPAVKTA